MKSTGGSEQHRAVVTVWHWYWTMLKSELSIKVKLSICLTQDHGVASNKFCDLMKQTTGQSYKYYHPFSVQDQLKHHLHGEIVQKFALLSPFVQVVTSRLQRHAKEFLEGDRGGSSIQSGGGYDGKLSPHLRAWPFRTGIHTRDFPDMSQDLVCLKHTESFQGQ